LRFSDLANEPEALAGNRSDQALTFTAIADRLANCIDMAGHRRFRDDPPAPHRMQQAILADNALAVLHQVDQQVEDLRPNGNRLGSPGQLPPLRVEHAVSKHELHFGAPNPARPAGARSRGTWADAGNPGKLLIARLSSSVTGRCNLPG
jgi:hypothetical protein